MAATHLTTQEATKHLAALTDDEWRRVYIFAKFLLKHSREDYRYQELVDEAVARTLAGRRRWKIGMNGPAHLFGAMKSILSSWNKSAKRRGNLLVSISDISPETEFEPGESYEDMIAALASRAAQLIERGVLGQVESKMLSGFLAGEDANVIAQQAGLSAKECRQVILSLINMIGS
jgi:DNA-directed RNA polymerase specialized sigma24 family protein